MRFAVAVAIGIAVTLIVGVAAAVRSVPQSASRATLLPVRLMPLPLPPSPVPPHPHRTPTATLPLPYTSGWSLTRAIRRIPTYRPGVTRWVITARYGHWGLTNWYTRVIYISSNVPADRLYDVAAHEWSHILQALDYRWDIQAAVRAMDRWYGAHGIRGAEYAADCMAILQGATWTGYTRCRSTHWRAGARRLLHGQRL